MMTETNSLSVPDCSTSKLIAAEHQVILKDALHRHCTPTKVSEAECCRLLVSNK